LVLGFMARSSHAWRSPAQTVADLKWPPGFEFGPGLVTVGLSLSRALTIRSRHDAGTVRSATSLKIVAVENPRDRRAVLTDIVDLDNN
jgi:hypothetical protein